MEKLKVAEKILVGIAFIISLVLEYQIWTEDTKWELNVINEFSDQLLFAMIIMFAIAIVLNIYVHIKKKSLHKSTKV